ncbi:MAG: nuclear transport factor 2 family protein [Natronospirillum sp.]
MSVSKQFLIDFNEAWAREDKAAILAAVTDDIQFRMAGEEDINGKEAFAAVLEEMAGTGQEFTLTINRVIISAEDTAAVEGEMTLVDEDGEPVVFMFCDVYGLRDGKIAELKAFVVEKEE